MPVLLSIPSFQNIASRIVIDLESYSIQNHVEPTQKRIDFISKLLVHLNICICSELGSIVKYNLKVSDFIREEIHDLIMSHDHTSFITQ